MLPQTHPMPTKAFFGKPKRWALTFSLWHFPMHLPIGGIQVQSTVFQLLLCYNPLLPSIYPNRSMAKIYPGQLMTRPWKPSRQPRSPSWSRCWDEHQGPRCSRHHQSRSWWTRPPKQTSPLNTSWLSPRCPRPAHPCWTPTSYQRSKYCDPELLMP